MSDLAGQKFGNYLLIRLLGRGGFADTYLGEQVYLKTQAAVKIVQARLAQTDQESFYNEARTIAHLTHPNIVRLLDFGVESSRNIPYLVMDYAPNGTLRQHHHRGESLPVPLVLSYVKQVAAALQYAHDRKTIHRDVKPENILVGANNEILLSDFGIAVVQNTRQQTQRDIAGTVTYMAPEQLQGNPTTASDQYALAIVAYEWLCGVVPFTGSYTEIALQQERAIPRPLRACVPTIPANVENVILTALSKDPQDRFNSVQAFATALEHAASIEPVSLQTASTTATDAQMYIATEFVPPQGTPPGHSSYGSPLPFSEGRNAQTGYGPPLLPSYPAPTPPRVPNPSTPVPQSSLTPPRVPNPSTPIPQSSATPPRVPNPSTPIPAVPDDFAPRITPQVTPLPSFYTQPGQIPVPATGGAGAMQRQRFSLHHLSKTMIVVLVAGLLLILLAGTLTYNAGITILHGVQATATAQARSAATAAAQARSTAVVRAQATATVMALMNTYTQATSGTPTISDPLSKPDNYGWTHISNADGACNFIGGTYHARAQVGYFQYCAANATNFADFAFQVEMSIISGNQAGGPPSGAGIVFRAPPSGTFSAYHFYVNLDGSYNLYKVTDSSSSNGSPTFTPLQTGFSPAIHTGLNQTNLITVIARGGSFYLYVNKQYITAVVDNSYKSGMIGVVANSSDTGGTEAAFRNAQVWQF
jgi:serine/threonine protein kinase